MGPMGTLNPERERGLQSSHTGNAIVLQEQLLEPPLGMPV